MGGFQVEFAVQPGVCVLYEKVEVGSVVTFPRLSRPLSTIEARSEVEPFVPVPYPRTYFRTQFPFTLASISFMRYFELTPNSDRKSTRLNSSHANISYAV